jgi:hypothetical protein
LAFFLRDVDLPPVIIVIGIDVIASLQFLERPSPFILLVFHREARCLFEYLMPHNM